MLKRLNAAATVGVAVRKGCCFGRLFAWAVSNNLVALFDYLRGPWRAVACVLLCLWLMYGSVVVGLRLQR